MASVTYTYVGTCAGGGHVTLDVSFNAGPNQRTTVDIDEMRAPLSEVPETVRKAFVEMALRIHIAGKTRGQIASEFSSPVTVQI